MEKDIFWLNVTTKCCLIPNNVDGDVRSSGG